ncbi:MAG: PKD domain-containing protein [Gemmatimonadales bacterium]
MAVSTVVLAAAWACGGDGGNVQPNTPPVANFTAPACTAGNPCTFASTSTDADGTITATHWDFADDQTSADGTSVAHLFAAAGTFNVTLTVTDNAGDKNAKTLGVVVTAATPVNVPPVASFTVPTCAATAACTFTSTSTDADGTVVSAHWDFGDQTSMDGLSVDHTYSAAGTFNVTLTVTDDKGAASTPVTQAVTVNPAAAQDCTTSGSSVVCTLTITSRSTISVAINDRSCELDGNNLTVEQPRKQTLFFNMCNQAVGTSKTITDDTGTPFPFDVGTQLRLTFVQGRAGPGDPAVGFPAAKLSNSFPSWTINIDDGGDPHGNGEPDFTDVILSVQATPAP